MLHFQVLLVHTIVGFEPIELPPSEEFLKVYDSSFANLGEKAIEEFLI